MDTAARIQSTIEAREAYDAIEYGIRSIKISRNAFGASAAHSAQIIAGCQAATRATGEFIAQDYATIGKLKIAKKIAGETLKAAQAAQREIGTARQIRLALAA